MRGVFLKDYPLSLSSSQFVLLLCAILPMCELVSWQLFLVGAMLSPFEATQILSSAEYLITVSWSSWWGNRMAVMDIVLLIVL